MNTPEQLADEAITETIDQAIGHVPRDISDRLRAQIWSLIRDAKIEISQRTDEEAG